MSFRRSIIASAVCLIATPAAAADLMTDAQAEQLSSAIFNDIVAGKPASAIDKADELIAAFNVRQAKRAHACAESQEQAEALAKKNDAEVTMELTIVGPAWCDGYFYKGYALIDLGRGRGARRQLRWPVERRL